MDEDFDEGSEEQEELLDELDPNNPEHAFQILERQFGQTIAEIEQDPQMSQYADDFNKLMEVLFETHEKELQMREKCDELEIQVAENENKVMIAGKIQDSDRCLIKELKDQIQMAWKLADAAHAREQAAQEMIDNLRKQINSLNAEIDFKNKMGQDDNEEGEQSKHKEGLQRERDKLLGEVAKLHERLHNALGYQEELERRTSEADIKINEITTTVEIQSVEIDKFKTLRDNLSMEIAELQSVVLNKDGDIGLLREAIATGTKATNKVEHTVKEQKQIIDKMQKEADNITNKYAKLQDEFDSANYNLEKTKKQFNKMLIELKLREEELARTKTDLDKVSKVREGFDKKIMQLESDRDSANIENEKIKQSLGQMEREIEGGKKASDEYKRNNEKLTREKELMTKNLLRQQGLSRDHLKLIKIQQQIKRKLEAEIDTYVMERGRMIKQIKYLEKERDRLMEEQLDLTKRIEDYIDEFKLKKAEMYDMKKTLVENENKIRMQQNVFDTIRAERNALQKSLQESTAECSELKVKLKVTGHQTEQLKEDISMKEQLLVKEENLLRKVIKEKENLRVELNSCLDQIRKLKDEIWEMNAEEKRLHKVIMKDDKLIRQQSKDLEQLMNERDILGSQLVRRNDELALLYEKIKILQTTLHRGEAQYDQRLEDIRLLKIEIRRLRQEKHLLTKSINNMTDLRHEVFYLERDLNRERIKCKALEEELQNPMNIHRWRKLEGSDPDLFECLQKIQFMQKRLLNQASESLITERKLKESQRLYINLRQIVAKQPGPELQTQLVKTQRALTVRINKMKCLVSELNMTEVQASEYRLDLERKNGELKKIKQKYLAEKKANSKRVMCLHEAPSKTSNQSSTQQIKFTGGGFRMSVTSANQ